MKAKTDLGLSGRLPNIISESGLYKLIMRSDEPEAREFQDWVTREVLPANREDGMYVAGEEKVSASNSRGDQMTADALAWSATTICPELTVVRQFMKIIT